MQANRGKPIVVVTEMNTKDESQAQFDGEHDSEFERKAAAVEQPGLIAEFWDFLRHNKKWWLTPIVIVMLLLSVLVWLGGTGAAPFIYTLF